MSRKTIAVDVDDVLALSVEAWVAFSNKQWGTHLTADDYHEDWIKLWGVDEEERRRRASHIYTSGLLTTYRSLEQAEAVLQRLARRYKLVITTSRVEDVKQETLDWLERHFGNMFSEIHLTGFYDKFGDAKAVRMTKGALLESIGADYLIDDQPKHCLAAAEVGVTAILFGDYVWNRDVKKLPPAVIRCRDWRAVGKYFDGQPD
jgi:5'(3')-deoxyribonucleotidase